MAIKCPRCQSSNSETATFCADCGARLDSPNDISISVTKTIVSPVGEGRTIAGKYTFIEPIGKGGMGVIYKAEDIKLERIVALKFLPAELTEDPEARERFVREAKAAAALAHPHICTVYEIGEEANQYFIAMECIEGQSLKEKILKGHLDQAEALDIAIQVAEGLEEAHGKGIIHRDIKPGNIMVTDKGLAKVMDFGLAKVFGASLITKEARTMGTVAYMSPEQAQGQSVDHRTDIWSLGVVLYEMLIGQLPFRGEYDQSIIHSILSREPEPLTKVLPAIPKALESVLLTALAKNPADRYQSMGELLDDLRAVGEGLKPLRARARPLRSKIFGINKLHFYTGLIVLFAIAAAMIFLFLPGRGNAVNSVAILPIINDSGDPLQDYFANSLTDRLIAEFYKVSALRCASRQSVMVYAATTKSPQQIARELNVKAIVEASVFKSGNRIRLIARLIDPKRNRQIWGDTFEREYSDILFLQSDLAQAIVNGIKVKVQPEERALLASARKVNPKAYDLVLQGIDFYTGIQTDENSLNKSLDRFQVAIDIDPTLALAHAWEAHIYLELGATRRLEEKETNAKARNAALKALELDRNLAMAHSSLGIVKLSMDWDFAGAERELRKAIDLAPGDLSIPFFYYTVLCWSGRAEEAITSLQRQFRKTPRDEAAHAARQFFHFLWAKRYDEALGELRIEESRNSQSSAYFGRWYAVVYALKGLCPEALAEIDKIKDQPFWRAGPWFRRDHAWILALCGRREKALEALEEHKSLQTQKKIDTTYDEACVYAGFDDKGKAFECLNKAYKNHSSQMVELITDWCFHSLHDDPRFQDLVKKVGFPDVPTAAER